jgi:hypothetical protein
LPEKEIPKVENSENPKNPENSKKEFSDLPEKELPKENLVDKELLESSKKEIFKLESLESSHAKISKTIKMPTFQVNPITQTLISSQKTLTPNLTNPTIEGLQNSINKLLSDMNLLSKRPSLDKDSHFTENL